MISDAPINPAEELSRFTAQNPQAGAIVSFSGHVRADDIDGDATQTLVLQAYEPLTEDGITDAIQTARTRFAVDDICVRHRIGHMAPTDTIVFVAAASKHRRDAFLAADFLMDYLKTEAFFWKKEIGSDSETWVEPRSADYQDAQRWQTPKDK